MAIFAERFDVVAARGHKLHILPHGEYKGFLCGYRPRYLFERTEGAAWGDRNLLHNTRICQTCRQVYDRENALWLEEQVWSVDEVKIILWGMVY